MSRTSRFLAVALSVAVWAIAAGPGPATAVEAPVAERSPGATWQATPGGWVSGPVEYLKTIPLDAVGGSSATIHDGLLYVSTFRSFSIYDLSDPETPLPLSTTALGVQLFNEQPETNGEILLLAQDFPSNALQIWDVSDPALPTKIRTFALAGNDHMWKCIRSCRYAYSGMGTILDLKNPAEPKVVGNWNEGLGYYSKHAIQEVAPEILMTGTVPSYTLDARKNPTKPKVIATTNLTSPKLSGPGGLGQGPPAPPAFIDWPVRGSGRYVLISIETPFAGDCDDASGTFATFDTRTIRKKKTLTFVDDYRLEQTVANPAEGRSPAHVFGCSPYSFGTPRDFEKSRRVAVPWFEQGMRLLNVSKEGKVTEIGGFLPAAGSSSKAVWVTDNVVYVVDLMRGLDILRVGD